MSISTPTKTVAAGIAATLAALAAIAVVTTRAASEPVVTHPTDVLQAVHVGLSHSAAIETIDGTTISIDADGASTSDSTTYAVSDTVDDLPVRVSTRYRTDESTGADLADLTGYSGPVTIDITIENLTVGPQDITFDVAGRSHTEPSLVGVPLTLAASTLLTGVTADHVVIGAPDGTHGTNGIVSSTEDGDTVVQWATILAPPRSGASTTLRLVVNAQDFSVPAIDLAIQPGIGTDLSMDGVLTGAFGDEATSELGLQKRTIALITEVTEVLVKAGSTITEVRTNLENTSETLGVRTAAELKDSSEALATTMAGLTTQLATLQSDLDATVQGTESTVTGQLRTTVAAVGSMLGEATGPPPSVVMDGRGCAAVVDDPSRPTTVYSSLMTMSAQLDAYARSNAECGAEVSAALLATIGPERPSPEQCTGHPSMTCTLYGSVVTVSGALIDLVHRGDEITAGLQPDLFAATIGQHQVVAEGLTDVNAQVELLRHPADPATDYEEAMATLAASITTTGEGLDLLDGQVAVLLDQVNAIHASAQSARAALVADAPTSHSMVAQNQQVADRLCELSDQGVPQPGRIPAAQVDQMRSYLTGTPCGAPEPGAEVDPESPPIVPLPTPPGYPAPMDTRLRGQVEAWDAVIAATDTTPAATGLGPHLQGITDQIGEIRGQLAAVETARQALASVVAGQDHSTSASLDELATSLATLTAASNELGGQLEGWDVVYAGLGEQIEQAFRDAAGETTVEVASLVGEQVRIVSAEGTEGVDAVTSAFSRSVTGLSTTSRDVAADARDTVGRQRSDLAAWEQEVNAAVTDRTAQSLHTIATSTGASTRDVQGASELLAAGLTKVMLDLGDREVNGSGILGAMATSAAQAGTADFQLALATQNAEGYSNLRGQDVESILLRQAQFKASLAAADRMAPFHLDVPSGATTRTLYTFTIGADR